MDEKVDIFGNVNEDRCMMNCTLSRNKRVFQQENLKNWRPPYFFEIQGVSNTKNKAFPKVSRW